MEKQVIFAQRLKYEREKQGWSQAEVAERLQTDAKTVGRWERGKHFPRHYQRRALCELFEKSLEEFGLLESDPLQERDPVPEPQYPSRVHWGEAPHIELFYGRERELELVKYWLLDRKCRMVTIFGMGGMGKTTLAAYLADQIQDAFECIFWRSLLNAPPLKHFLKHCIRFIAGQPDIDLPELLDDQISLLIHYLRAHRCLLILDNAETLFQAEQQVGRYRDGYEGYRLLLRRIGETQHESCLLLTSREKPGEIALLEGKASPVQSLHLTGVGYVEGQKILQDKELIGSSDDWKTLIDHYAGNPLALKLVSEYIDGLFEGKIDLFLRENEFAFGSINDLLDQQLSRLFKQEQAILFWLAIEQEATTKEKINENLVEPLAKGVLLEALDSLQRRSLLEKRGATGFLLQPVVMEHMRDRLIRQAYQEFLGAELDVWANYAFLQAQANDYIRENQVRFILHPLAEQLVNVSGKEGIERQVKHLLALERQRSIQRHGYVAGNALNLLAHLQLDLQGMDFSALTIRQAWLQGISLSQTNFSSAHFVASVFTNTFGNILSVAFSQQGRLFATGTATGDVWVYQVAKKALLRICSGHTDGVWSVAFSQDERLLVTSSDDQTIRLWEIETGNCLGILRGHSSRVRAVAFSPDNVTLVSGSDDEAIRLWQVDTGRCLGVLPGNSDSPTSARIWGVAFSRDGTVFASGSTDGIIAIWDTRTWQVQRRLRGHSDGVRSIAFHPDGTLLASAGNDQTIRFWDRHTGECIKIVRGHTNRVWSIAFSPDGQYLASGSEDRTVRLWDVQRYVCLKIFQSHSHGVRSVAFSPDTQVLASGGDDQTIRFWNVEGGQSLQTLQGYTNRIWSIALHPDRMMLVSGYEDQTICLWDLEAVRCLYTLPVRSHGVRSVAFSPDGTTFASGGEDQTIRIWDTSTGRHLSTLQGHSNWIWSIAFSPDGRTLASGSEDQTVCLWNSTTRELLFTLRGHTSWIRSVAFSPDGNLLASGGDDQTIRLWDVHTGQCLAHFDAHTNRVRSVTFSPDGRILASSSEDRTICLWEVATGHALYRLQGHTNWVRSVAFSPDGRTLASGGDDQVIRLWEVKTGRCLAVLRGHLNRIRSVCFCPDGRELVSSSDDGMILLWDIQTTSPGKIVRKERPYEQMNIFHVEGLTAAQKASLALLGAVELPSSKPEYLNSPHLK